MARKMAPRLRRRVRKIPPMEDTKTTIQCAYCEGTGRDPWGIPSVLSNCQVCLGRGTVKIQEPTVECAACSGTGMHGGGSQRLTCLACGGKGRIAIIEPVEKCPRCDGLGVDTYGLYCLGCEGKGVVTIREAV
ncbi:MAG: hypothetical protein ACE5HY_03165 [Candidatus Hydrothermarchaeales archaeon]